MAIEIKKRRINSLLYVSSIKANGAVLKSIVHAMYVLSIVSDERGLDEWSFEVSTALEANPLRDRIMATLDLLEGAV